MNAVHMSAAGDALSGSEKTLRLSAGGEDEVNKTAEEGEICLF